MDLLQVAVTAVGAFAALKEMFPVFSSLPFMVSAINP